MMMKRRRRRGNERDGRDAKEADRGSAHGGPGGEAGLGEQAADAGGRLGSAVPGERDRLLVDNDGRGHADPPERDRDEDDDGVRARPLWWWNVAALAADITGYERGLLDGSGSVRPHRSDHLPTDKA